jgi:hypothetical protein
MPTYLPTGVRDELETLKFSNQSSQDIAALDWEQRSLDDISTFGADLKLPTLGSQSTAPAQAFSTPESPVFEAPTPTPISTPRPQSITTPAQMQDIWQSGNGGAPDATRTQPQDTSSDDLSSTPTQIAPVSSAPVGGGQAPAGAPSPSGTPAAMPTGGGDLRTAARSAALRNGVDPAIYERQIDTESQFNPAAVNPNSGARGLAQFMPATAQSLGINPDNPIEALEGGARYMKQLLSQFGGDYTKALAAYNWGMGNVAKWAGDLASLPGETRQYIQSILTPAPKANPAALPDIPQRDVDPQHVVSTYKRQYDLSNITPNQFEEGKALGLDPESQAALCGIAGAVALQRAAGQDPSFAQTYQTAQSLKEWSKDLGMVHGSQGEIALLGAMNVPARLGPLNPQTIAAEVQAGRPVEINAHGGGGHFFVASGVRQGENGLEFNFGNSAAILRRSGGQTWFRLDQLAGLGVGTPSEAIYLGSEAK